MGKFRPEEERETRVSYLLPMRADRLHIGTSCFSADDTKDLDKPGEAEETEDAAACVRRASSVAVALCTCATTNPRL